jgi:ABC-type multidrug transport system fused ATPase/permease subunit
MLSSCLLIPILTKRKTILPSSEKIQRAAELNGFIVESMQGLADALAFNQESKLQQKLAQMDERLGCAQKSLIRVEATANTASQLAMNLTLAVIVVLGGSLVVNGQMDGAVYAACALAVLAGFELIFPLPQVGAALQVSLAAGDRLFALDDLRPEVLDPQKPVNLPPGNNLEISRISFSYPHAQTQVLRDISFSLLSGSSLGIVGPSGAGKSTLIELLLRFWDYPEGTINLGGEDVRLLRQQDLHSRLSVVDQHSTLFNATLRQNLCLGNPEATDKEMLSALFTVELNGWFAGLNDGLDTWLGEQGLNLSGGERQRLLLARALLKPAEIFVLDEPGAHLDEDTAGRVMGNFLYQLKGKSILLVSHRLSDLMMLDEILVISAGKIIERGSPAKLLAQESWFAQAYQKEQDIL